MAGGVWQQELASLQEAGFTPDEIAGEQGRQRQEMSDSGFSGSEIDGYFGVKTPDMGPIKAHFEENFAKAREAAAPAEGAPPAPAAGPQPLSDLPGQAPVTPKPGEKTHNAETFLEALEAGLQMSVSGLIARGQKPDLLVPEDAPMFYRIASQAATLAGDLPAMMAGTIPGSIFGAEMGSIVPGAGTAIGAVVGAGAGASALPAGMRRILMDHYEKGDVANFQDFWERAAGTFIDATKAGIVGGATMGVGSKVAAVAAPAVKTVAQMASEVATMVTVGKALDGQVPKPEDFLEAALVVGGLHGATKAGKPVAAKLREIYAATGVRPEQIAEQASKDVTLQQDILASNKDIPDAYASMADAELRAKQPASIEIKSDAAGEKHAVLGDHAPEGGLKIEKPAEAAPEKPAYPAEGEKAVTPYETAKAAVLDRVGEEGKKGFNLSFDRAYEANVDELHPLNVVSKALSEGKGLKASDDPYVLARLSRDYAGKVDHMVRFGTFDYKTGEVTGKSLREILEPFARDRDGLIAHLIADRAIELEGRGIKSGIPIEDAKAVIESGGKKYAAAAKDLVSFQNEVLGYLRDSGRISGEAYRNMAEANKAYIPFYRLTEDGGVAGGKKSATGPAIKKIKGSDSKIVDPIQSVVKNVMEYVRMAEENRALTALADLAEKSGDAGKALLEPVARKLRPIDVKSDEVAKFFKEQGIDADPAEFTIFRPEQLRLGKNEIAIFRDGKPQVFSVDPEVARAVRAMQGDRVAANLFFKLMAIPVKTLRASLSFTPEFITRNFIRDQMTASATSRSGMIPFVDSVMALGSLWKEDAHYQNWLKSGGTNAAFAAMDKSYIESNVWKLSKETGLLDSARNLVKHPLQAMRVAAELVENSTRLAEYKKVTKGSQDLGKIFEGGYASREVTVDFQRIGASVRAMNMITAFWNVQVQGLDRTVRAFSDNPTGTMARVTAAITIPSLLLWYANHDDPRYVDIPRWEKDLFWIVMTKDNVYRIPKPFEVGVLFGSMPERALDLYFADNPRAMKGFMETIKAGLFPGVIPTAVTPALEVFANRSTFTGGPIIPRQLEGILPEYQYNEYTTETAKTLGKVIASIPGLKNTKAASPMVIENVVRAWGGNLGMYALKVGDKLLSMTGEHPDPVKPASTLADIPFIKAFVIRNPSATAQSIQDFYDRHADNKQVVDTIRHLAQSGDYDNMRKELGLRENQAKLVTLDGIKDALTNQSKFVRMIVKNPSMTADDKRRQIDQIYNAMIQEAKLGNKLFDEVEKSMSIPMAGSLR